ncbi:hypothetical protein IPA_07335 [Ignicoccus pacificus DSM 13166]|uniref:HD/PDEase domain-containing protein n=1 Tax=Ignicoccus pacificus DSM 13166 TaxID=940294 RepID=A0A977KBM8_9CREN|nr:hypothetical protein IPA_07335 [Ignicoccus pacificus DSM 13166]
MERKTVRDPIHGFIEFPSDLFETLIDTEIFQRLREIRQLGLSHYVYPGANHTRFEHSLGVAHVVKNMLNNIRKNTEEMVIRYLRFKDLKEYAGEVLDHLDSMKKEIIVAALLHDLGHVALSHVFEVAMKDYIYYIEAKEKSVQTMVSHEHLTLSLLNEMKERLGPIKYAGEEVKLELVEEILKLAYIDKEVDCANDSELNAKVIASQMISSEIDADRGDYILRDYYFSGATAGLYDLDRLYNVIAIVPKRVAQKVFTLGVVEKGISVIENMLLSRVYMYNDVYLHPISIIYSAMATRVLSLILALPDEDLRTLANGYPEFSQIRKIMLHDIPELYESVLNVTDGAFYRILRRIVSFGKELKEGSEISLERPDLFLALYTLAKGILSRRHWSALIMNEYNSRSIVRAIKEDRDRFMYVMKRNLNPFVIFYHSAYEGLSGEVYVFDRSKPHEAVPIQHSPRSVVSRNLKGSLYAKVTIVFPKTMGRIDNLSAWRLKEGKAEGLFEDTFMDKKEVEELLRESFEKALSLAWELQEWSSGRVD